MNHDTDADSGEAPDAAGRPSGRRDRVPALPGPRAGSDLPVLGPPTATVAAPSERPPAFEVSVSPRNVYVTVELPGAAKDALDLEATDTTLTVVGPRVGGPAYRVEIDLLVRVDPRSAKATYRNGILDVTLARAPSSEGDTHEA